MSYDDNAVEWQERHLAPGRKAEPIAMRRSRARLDSLLTPTMRDASREIDQGYEARSSGLGYALLGSQSNPMFRTSGGLDMTEEIIEKLRHAVENLSRWEKLCTPFLRDTVYALNQTEHTATTYAAQHNKTTGEVTMWYREGLRVYVKLRGWE